MIEAKGESLRSVDIDSYHKKLKEGMFFQGILYSFVMIVFYLATHTFSNVISMIMIVCFMIIMIIVTYKRFRNFANLQVIEFKIEDSILEFKKYKFLAGIGATDKLEADRFIIHRKALNNMMMPLIDPKENLIIKELDATSSWSREKKYKFLIFPKKLFREREWNKLESWIRQHEVKNEYYR
ncbi:MAG: hypothetical protein AAF944_05870 [Bacteroidota bacterium]